uniref:Uncharacterized protein n=1 Tax=Anguilla anguilla TaxID=7936 RepID=A0A0E9WC58_ANGAN
MASPLLKQLQFKNKSMAFLDSFFRHVQREQCIINTNNLNTYQQY